MSIIRYMAQYAGFSTLILLLADSWVTMKPWTMFAAVTVALLLISNTAAMKSEWDKD